MFKKLSIRWRLTILSALLLTVCCVGLTIVMIFSAFRLVDSINSTVMTPAKKVFLIQDDKQVEQDVISSIPTEELINAKRVFNFESLIYMLIFILGGSALTYYVSGKALKPLNILNDKVKNLHVNSLSESLDVPPTKDEISELTKSFNEMTDKLNDAFMTQKRFSASAAHELRTPLTVLKTKVDVFKKKDTPTKDEYEVVIAVFEKQINRLRLLVSNLLDMTNMDDNMEQSKISLQDVFEDIVSELSGIAKAKNISISLNCDDSSFYGNLDLLYRAFYNLVENGIKYNVSGGYVKIDVYKIKEQTVIEIKDSGIGIPNEMKKLIFEPFYRVDKSRSREMGGIGLGLSIVDSIIKKHGGKISVFDNTSKGTCFKIIFYSVSI